ncbi:MAG TPA: shikimate kinase [Acidimicrobiia bacterium]|nr:shikimate kinase [Acidimicrobiia bacterium]
MAEGRRHVIIVGPMGVGKTTVGEHLAARLGRPFLDSDEVMEDRFGERSSEIAARARAGAPHGSARRSRCRNLAG